MRRRQEQKRAEEGNASYAALSRSQRQQGNDMQARARARGQSADLLTMVQAVRAVGGSPASNAAQELLGVRGFGDRELTADQRSVLDATEATLKRVGVVPQDMSRVQLEQALQRGIGGPMSSMRSRPASAPSRTRPVSESCRSTIGPNCHSSTDGSPTAAATSPRFQ